MTILLPKRQTTMLNDPRSHGLWEMTAPSAPQTVAFSGKADADVVIVGGGYTGFSTALHLAERGTRVILLVWMYYAAMVFFVGALITAVIDERARLASVRRALAERAARQAGAPPQG